MHTHQLGFIWTKPNNKNAMITDDFGLLVETNSQSFWLLLEEASEIHSEFYAIFWEEINHALRNQR